MKQLTYKFFVLCLALCLAFPAFAASEAEFKKLSKSWTLHADGSQEFRYAMELTIFTHTAMRSAYGESFVVYNPEYQTLTINESYTKQTDGTIVKTPANAFVEVLPRAAANAPAYNGLKEMVIVHTGLELGATIYLDYTLKTKPGYLPALDILEPICQSSPVRDYSISISVPKDKPLFACLLNPEVKGKENADAADLHTISWNLKNVPAMNRETKQALYAGDIQYLAASTYSSEAEALKGLYKQFETQESMPLLSLAETVVEGKTTDTDKLLAVLDFVQNDFAHSFLKLEETGYRVRPVEEVIRSAYGTDAELTNLLQGLLNALKIKAEVGVRMVTNDYTPNCLGLKLATLFVRAKADGKEYLMNVHDNSMDQAGWLADRCRIVRLADGQPMSDLPKPENALSAKAKISIDKDQVITEIEKQIPNGLAAYNHPQAATSSEKNPVKRVGTYMMISLPDSPKGISHSTYIQMNSKRETPLPLLYAPSESYSYEVTLPAGTKLATPTGTTTLTNEAGSMEVTIQQEGNIVNVTRTLKVTSTILKGKTYEAFHALLAAWVNPNNNSLLIKAE